MLSVRHTLVALLCLASFQIVNAGWNKRESGTLAWLHSVYFIDDRHGWVVGSSGTMLATVDGGTTWTKQKKITQDDIRDVYFSDEQNGWVLCERSIHYIGKSSPS